MFSQKLKKLDQRVAKVEAAIAALLLLFMIFIAAFQALFRNLADFGFHSANTVLGFLEWGDPFLQKGTMLLAFLGASLATFDDKHIGIDVLQRIAPPKIRSIMRALLSLGAAVTCLLLAYVFWIAIVNISKDIPVTYSIYENGKSLHLCDASLNVVQEAGLNRPEIFCAIRSALGLLGAPASTPEFAIQSLLPFMFVLIALRFFGRAVSSTLSINSTPPEAKPSHDENVLATKLSSPNNPAATHPS